MKLFKKLRDMFYIHRAQDIFSKGSEEKIKLFFEKLPSDLKEDVSKILYKKLWNDQRRLVRQLVVDAVLEYGTPEEIREAIVTFVPFSKVLARGNQEEIFLALKKQSYDWDLEKYLLETRNKEALICYLNSMFGDTPSNEIIDLAISMDCCNILIERNIRILEDKMKQIIQSGDKKVIMTFINQLSSYGLNMVLDNTNIKLTSEERQEIEKRLVYQKKDEKLMSAISSEFDTIR